MTSLDDAMRWLAELGLDEPLRSAGEGPTVLDERAADPDPVVELLEHVAGVVQACTDQHRWRQWAACRGVDAEVFFPVRPEDGADDPHAAAARAMCATCPVVVACLEQALAVDERDGVWGGASTRLRRRMADVFGGRVHDYDPDCDDAGCRWCLTVREHLEWLEHRVSSHLGRPRQLNGRNASHGIRATYARGCRCSGCRFSASVSGQQLAAAGQDPRRWWAALGWLGSKDASRAVVARSLVDALTVAA